MTGDSREELTETGRGIRQEFDPDDEVIIRVILDESAEPGPDVRRIAQGIVRDMMPWRKRGTRLPGREDRA